MDSADILLMVVVGCGTLVIIARIFAAALLRQRQQPPSELPRGLEQRLEQMEVALDAIALEVERLGEHQRFTAHLAQGQPEREPERLPHYTTPI